MKSKRSILLILLAFVVITAFTLGLFMMVRPGATLHNLSIDMLKYSIFKRFFIVVNSLSILLTISSFTAFIQILKNKQSARIWCYVTGILLTAWITIEIVSGRQINWLHFLYLFIDILILFLSYKRRSAIIAR